MKFDRQLKRIFEFRQKTTIRKTLMKNFLTKNFFEDSSKHSDGKQQ